MKWLRRLFILIVILGALLSGLFLCLPLFNDYQTRGTLNLPGLTGPVTIVRDEKGMAYIRAENQEDLFMAQGFVTAQDRLFQMQLTRLFAQGRICELAGDKAKQLDMRMRTLGLHRMARKHAQILAPEHRSIYQKYVDGINAFIEQTPDDLPLEFKLAGIKPEKWEISDSLCIAYYMGFDTSANLRTEIISQMLLEILGYEKAAQILPLNFNPDDPADTGEIDIPRESRLSRTHSDHTALLALLTDEYLRLGSNNWAVAPAKSQTGKALLAGDPHLDIRVLPGVWYPVGLFAPGIRSVGAQVAGHPGMAIGRTDHIAIAMTNNYGDMVDLYIETADPDRPGHYMEGETSIPFTTHDEVLKIKDKDAPGGFKTHAFQIRATTRGPIVTDLIPELTTQKLLSFRFAPAQAMTGKIGLLDFLTARSAAELTQHIGRISMICLNWVFADKDGNIGHKASGRIPVRTSGDGTFPHPVKDATDNWLGFIPHQQMPGDFNPAGNWIGTCNHKVVDSDYPYYYSSYAAASYRYRRLKELMNTPDKKSADDMWQYQRDAKNVMAQILAPVIADILSNHDETRFMAQILSQWDFSDDAQKAAPAIFQTVYPRFAQKVFADELGRENAAIMLKYWYFWTERLQRMVLEGDSEWFDNVNTPDRKETMADLFYEAALETKQFLSQTLGQDPSKWEWGRIHTLTLVNPLARDGAARDILGTGPLPMGGSGETLYRASFGFNTPYDINNSAALRMVVDFSDDDKVMAVLPGGVAARTFHPHQKDQVGAYMSGEKIYWWFSDQAVDQHAESELVLLPQP